MPFRSHLRRVCLSVCLSLSLCLFVSRFLRNIAGPAKYFTWYVTRNRDGSGRNDQPAGRNSVGSQQAAAAAAAEDEEEELSPSVAAALLLGSISRPK